MQIFLISDLNRRQLDLVTFAFHLLQICCFGGSRWRKSNLTYICSKKREGCSNSFVWEQDILLWYYARSWQLVVSSRFTEIRDLKSYQGIFCSSLYWNLLVCLPLWMDIWRFGLIIKAVINAMWLNIILFHSGNSQDSLGKYEVFLDIVGPDWTGCERGIWSCTHRLVHN